VGLVVDGSARLATLLVDDSLCSAADIGWATWKQGDFTQGSLL